MENTKFKKFNIYTFFIIVAAVCGMALSLIVPISQTPDEGMHFYNMLMSYGTMELYAEEVQFMESSGMASFNDDNEVKLVDEQAYYDAGMKKYSYDLKLSDFSLSTWALKFWPGAIGFYLGVFLKMPIIVCHQMAELFALIFYIIMGVITLKLIPFRKEVMLFIMLMPMVLQQAGSINPDVIVNSCSFLATAYILHLKFREKKVGWKDIIILGLLGLELLIAKEIYVLILAGIFIIPLDHFELKIGKKFELAAFIKKSKVLFIVLMVIGAAACVYLLRNSVYGKVLLACIMQPGRTLLLFKFSVQSLKDYYLQTLVGCFGWLDTYVSYVFIMIFCLVLMYIMLFQKKEDIELSSRLTLGNRITFFVIAIAVSMLVFLAMITWSFELTKLDLNADLSAFREYLYKIVIILGVQGRYFIPILPMVLIPLGKGYEYRSKKFYVGVQLLFYLFCLGHVVKIVFVRFWG